MQHGCSSLYEELFPIGDLLGTTKRTIVHVDVDFVRERYTATFRSSDGCTHRELLAKKRWDISSYYVSFCRRRPR